MREEIESLLKKSQRAIKSAEREFEAGDYDYACSRAYYSVFYLLEGVLLLDNKMYTKHSAVISVFNRDYIKAGIFQPGFSKYIKYLMKRREIGDYSFSIRIGEEDARNSISISKEMFDTISAFLKSKVEEREPN